MLLRVKKPAALVLLLTMTACTSLQPVAEPSGYVAHKSPSFVVVTTVEEDQGPMVVSGPRVEGGNLVGTLEGEQTAIPMTTIRTFRAVQPDKRKTMFAIIGGVVLTGAVTYLAFSAGSRIDNSPVCVPGGHRGDNPYCSGYDGARIP
jgi:hypothetical protein